MEKKFLSNNALLRVVILLALVGFPNAESVADNMATKFHAVSPNDIGDILTMISTQVRSNYERIKTWQGEIDSTVDTISEGAKAKRIFENDTNGIGEIPKTVRKRRESTVRFVADCEENSFYAYKYHRKPVEYIELETGRILGTKSVSSYEIVIGTPEYHILSRPDRRMPGGGPITRRMALKKASKKGSEGCANCGMEGVFDPRESLLPGRPVWETFPWVLEYIGEHGHFSVDGHSLKVEESMDGSIAKYRIQIPGRVSPGQYLFITMVFSSEKGFNITSVETTRADGQLFQKMTWDYGLVDGIYLPTKTTKQNYTGEQAKLTYEKRSTFKNLKINHPIPIKTFTHENLGLQNGDKFIDKILGRDYTYQDGELIPATSGSSYMPKQTIWPTANLNGDCCMNWEDLIILTSHWLDS